ncbi:MAG: hypothetical protein A2107_08055 [Verrucomicrobia bacterium GWF2_62_7]|nr:MAG: hypothetical protein A2107_08055 [Verrucomicrobia bacterium GWF2_62_7]
MTDRKGLTISAFFPAYNDEVTIQSMVLETDHILGRLCDEHEVIVINDASRDRTGEILDRLAAELPRLRVIHHARNRGYGGALISGMKAATKEWIFYTDGDGQYDVKELEKLVAHVGEADFITGYKIARSDSLFRIVVGKAYHWLNKTIFGLKVRDVDCDFRLMRRTLIQQLQFKTETGFFPVEMVRTIQDNGLRIREVPVHHYYRKAKGSQFLNVRNVSKVILAMRAFWNDLHAR